MKGLESIAGAILICLTVGCKKEPIKNFPSQDHISSISSSENKITESNWITASQWEVAQQPSHSVFHTNINTGNNSVSETALLVYRKDNTHGTIMTLPYEENKGLQKIYWYFEADGGNIMISADVYGPGANSFSTNSFKYIVLSEATVQDMEKRGISKTQLMTMPYEKFTELNQ